MSAPAHHLSHELIADCDTHLVVARTAWVAAPTSAQRSAAMAIINGLLDYRFVLMAGRDALAPLAPSSALA
jgi:hypothetical protein